MSFEPCAFSAGGFPRPVNLLAALLGLAVAVQAHASERPPAGVDLTVPLVSCVRAVRMNMAETIPVTGTLLPREEVAVNAEIEGTQIVDILVEEGDPVSRGQVLARLSRSVLDAQLEQLTAAVAVAEASTGQARSQIAQQSAILSQTAPALERAQALFKSGSIPAAVLEQRESDQRANEARLAAARQGLAVAEAEKRLKEAQRAELLVRIGQTDIKAPVDGVLIRREARLGAVTVPAGEPLFRIAHDNRIELEAEVPEFALPKIHLGQAAIVTVGDGEAIDGRVRAVLPEVDRVSRLGRVRIAFDRNLRLHPGAFAGGVIETARRTSIAVPAGAVLYDPSGTALQTVAGDTIVVNRIRTGLRMGNLVEILSGLVEGDVVVAHAGPFLGEGDRVTPVFPAAGEIR